MYVPQKRMEKLRQRYTLSYLLLSTLVFLLLTGCAKRIQLQPESVSHEWQLFFVKNITVSSEAPDSDGARAVVDGNIISVWKSQSGEPQAWISLELQNKATLNGIRIEWSDSAAVLYWIQVSMDGTHWDTVSEVNDGLAEESRTIAFGPVTAKYIRIDCRECAPLDYYMIKEIVLNPPASFPEVHVSASSDFAGNSPEFAIDGDPTTRWETEHGVDPGWIMVDFGHEQKMSKVKIKWERASAREYAIELSDDGIDWNTVAEIKNGLEDETRTIPFRTTSAQYLRIFGTKRTTEYGYSIWEIEVFE